MEKVNFGQTVTLVGFYLYGLTSQSKYNSNNGVFYPLMAKLQEFYLELRRNVLSPFPVSKPLFSGLVVFPASAVNSQAAPNPCAVELYQQNKVLAHHTIFAGRRLSIVVLHQPECSLFLLRD